MGMRKRLGEGIVYSSDHGKMCPVCAEAIDRCICRNAQPAQLAGDGCVRVGRETKGRKGAGVTLVTGFPGGVDDLAALCTRLKKRCGSGGTVKDGTIEIQGDHRDTIVAELTRDGTRVKRVGG